mmetsp:Transcript_2252/g.8722  ORF Transcript_2252/g.8722 Transcript_2252/m.8722 type:complete len:359 (-) Transcript_2252:73-1149(-)
MIFGVIGSARGTIFGFVGSAHPDSFPSRAASPRVVVGLERHGEYPRALAVEGVETLAVQQRMRQGGETGDQDDAEVVEVVSVRSAEALALHSAANAVARDEQRRAQRLPRRHTTRLGTTRAHPVPVRVLRPLGSPRAPPAREKLPLCPFKLFFVFGRLHLHVDALYAAVPVLHLDVPDRPTAEPHRPGQEPRRQHLANLVSRNSQVRPRAGPSHRLGQKRGSVIAQNAPVGSEGPVRARPRVPLAKVPQYPQPRQRGVGLREGHAVALPAGLEAAVPLEYHHLGAAVGRAGLQRGGEREAGDAAAGDDHEVAGSESVRHRDAGFLRAEAVPGAPPERRRRSGRVTDSLLPHRLVCVDQ